MTDLTITCPNCNHEIPLTESLAAPLLAEKNREFEAALAKKNREIAEREAAVGAKASELEKARSSLDATVAEKLAAERQRITSEEAAKAKQLLAGDIEEKNKALAELQTVLKARDLKLAEAQKAQADLLRKERELDDAKREMELSIEKQVQASLGAVREKAKLEVEEALKLRLSEKDQIIGAMQKQVDDLKRKAEQGSQQLQGEVLELELENLLRAKFPLDSIEPVPKGEFGGDVIQRVIGPSGSACGAMLWEMKRTKNWQDAWTGKLREDQRRAKADFAIIVSTALPKGVQTFDYVDGVWVADVKCAIPIALVLRQLLVDVAAARVAGEGQQTKMELVYNYLTGPRFRQRLEAIIEKFGDMREDLERERKAMMKLWAKREAQIEGVIAATMGMYGDLQGIAGKALKEIEGFELPGLEDQREEDDTGPIAAE